MFDCVGEVVVMIMPGPVRRTSGGSGDRCGLGGGGKCHLNFDLGSIGGTFRHGIKTG